MENSGLRWVKVGELDADRIGVLYEALMNPP
jgi:hypothetical protein